MKKNEMKETIYFTVTGLQFRHGIGFLKDMVHNGETVTLDLEKEPDNEYDKEAIMVKMAPLDKIGYVANSWRTVVGDCYSAGRLYDKMGDTATATVVHVLSDSVICSLDE